jgi:hypothetical protein
MERWMTDNLAVANGYRQLHDRVAHANSGTLLLICSYIDALAACCAGRDRESFGHHNVSIEADFVRFVSDYMVGFSRASERPSGVPFRRKVMVDRCAPGCRPNNPPVARKSLDYKQMLYKLYRNGVVHEFLPRGWAAYRRGSAPYLQWDSRRRRLVINLDHLVADFLAALQRYCNDVQSNRAKRTNFRKRIRFLMRH